MQVSRIVGALLLGAGCAGPAGDWRLREVESDGGVSVATGVLEVDRDGEVLLRLDAAGDGPVGRLEARGSARLDAEQADLSLVGQWEEGDAAWTVGVSGPCAAARDEMTCRLNVDGEAWTLALDREPFGG